MTTEWLNAAESLLLAGAGDVADRDDAIELATGAVQAVASQRDGVEVTS